jgi:hypothetical protein
MITLYLYINQGMVELNTEVYAALFNLFMFWFSVMWSVTILIALFRGVKFLFKKCYGGYRFELLACSGKEILEAIGYGDLVKVWRRWLMLIIWLVAAQMIVALIFTNLFTSYSGVFEWFNIYWLYTFLLIGGYFSFVLLGSRCNKIKVVKC